MYLYPRFAEGAAPMKDFVPKGNHALRPYGTSSGPTAFDNGAPVAGGELDDTAQIGAGSTNQSDTAGQFGGAGQIDGGYGYDFSWMLPLRPAAVVGTGPTPAPAPSVNPHQSADQVIAPPSPTGGQEAPARFYFSSEGAGETMSLGGAAGQLVSISPEMGAITGSGSIASGGVVTYVVSMPNIDLSRNIGMIIGNGETKPAPSSFGGVVAFTGSSGTLLLDPSSGFTGTVAGMSGQNTIDFSDINFTTPQAPSYSGTSSGGTLTLSDGSHTANVALIGNYLASAFVASSDGHGGTAVMQVPNQQSANESISPPQT